MRVGDSIGGRFLLEERAGAGAMGVVYRARDTATGARVAIKVMTVHDAKGALRFEREAAVLAGLRHPGIVAYVAHGVTPDGARFLAMEWLDGETLGRRVDRSPLTWLESIDVGLQIASALATAHAHGVLHRDLKPSNVVLVGGAVKVVDFGIARVLFGPPRPGAPLTASGEMIGTPAFMSPEQALGSKDLDHRSDLYSLGSMLYQCISGASPFAAESSLHMLMRLTTERAAPLITVAPSVPPALGALIDAMMSPEREGRPPSATAVGHALAAIRAEMSAEAKATRPRTTIAIPAAVGAAPRASPRGISRRGRVLLALAAVAVVTAAAAVWLATHAWGPRAPKAVVGERCPSGALACAELDASDLSAVDPFDAATEAVLFARTVRPHAEFMGFHAPRMGPRGVDLAGGDIILIDLTADVHVEVHGAVLVLVDGALDNDQAKARPWKRPECGPLQAYRAASVPSGQPVDIVFVRATSNSGQFHVLRNGPGLPNYLVIDSVKCGR